MPPAELSKFLFRGTNMTHFRIAVPFRIAVVALALVLVGGLLPSASIVRAQAAPAGPPKIGTCNVLKIITGTKEFKDIGEAAKKRQDDFNAQLADKKKQAQDMQTQLGFLTVDSPQYKQQNDALLTFSIQTDVWAKLTEVSEQRLEKANTKELFDKVDAAIKQVAKTKQLNLVLADQRQDIPANLDTIDINTLTQLLVGRSILYHDDNLDITQDVIIILDQAYAGAPAAH
jgi:Skp family chaperone for outer membrane proteins